MQIIKKLKLGGLIELVTSDLYEEGTSIHISDALEGIKEELEALHGVKLHKIIYDSYIKIECNNKGFPHLCPYHVAFRIEFRANRRNHQILQLENFSTEHTPYCRNDEQAQFLKNRHLLNQNQSALVKLIQKRTATGQPLKNPTEILEIFCEQEKLDKNFLYEGLQSNELKRKIKKKFDNIIAEVRRRCKDYIFSSDEKKNDENINDINEDSRIHESSSEDNKAIEILDLPSLKTVYPKALKRRIAKTKK